jgi:hypothetical protein
MITQDSKNVDELGKEDEIRAIESEITRLEAKRGLR